MTHQPVFTRTREELAAVLADLKGIRALVMTMGALHKEYLQLVRRAKELGGYMVVTIFINPTRFAPGEDLDAYPHTPDTDMAALESVGTDLVWTSGPGNAYPKPVDLSIDPDRIAHILRDTARSTHFAGATLVCTKVAGLVRPDVALFGEKDAQQLAVLHHVFSQLDVPVRVEGVPVVRDTDGVALSSHNRYLLGNERVRARSLSKGLEADHEAMTNGTSAEQAITAVLQVLETTRGIDADYVALVDEGTFDILAGAPDIALVTEKDARPATIVEGERACRILLVAKVGTTGLIGSLPVISEVEHG